MLRSELAVFYLGHENHVERIVATGDVETVTRLQDAKGMGAPAIPLIPRFRILPGRRRLRSCAAAPTRRNFCWKGKRTGYAAQP